TRSSSPAAARSQCPYPPSPSGVSRRSCAPPRASCALPPKASLSAHLGSNRYHRATVERTGATAGFFSMPRILRIALPLAAAAALVAGCGSGLPGNGVAKVGDTVITKDQFNHWMTAAAHGSATPGTQVVVPDPPTFTKCIANQAKQP